MIAPPEVPGKTVRASVLIPDSPDFFAFLLGALAALAKETPWQASVNVSRQDMAEIFSEAVESFRVGAVMEIGTFVHSIALLDETRYIPCYGQNLAMSDWPELMEVYPAVLKNYPSPGRFFVPNAQGRVLVGDGTDANGWVWPFLAQGGERVHTLSVAEMPAHSHTYAETLTVESTGGEVPAIATFTTTVVGSTSTVGEGSPHNNMPPYGVVKVYLVGKA